MRRNCVIQVDRVHLIGVGGTGSYLAQGLAKMVTGYKLDTEIILFDPDQVELKNCARQNFMPFEVGQNKAVALAFRLNQQYGLKIKAVPERYSYHMSNALIITCTDNLASRKGVRDAKAWLDLGNLRDTGQAIFGTTRRPSTIADFLKKKKKTAPVEMLPNAYLIAGMDNLQETPQIPSCADRPFEEQGPFVNELAAQAGLVICHQILVDHSVTTPRVYFDSKTGRMQPGFITDDYLKEFAKENQDGLPSISGQ